MSPHTEEPGSAASNPGSDDNISSLPSEPRQENGVNSSLEAALSYHRRGWAVLDLPLGSKSPGRKGWQHERHDTEDSVREAFDKGPRNVGVLLGPASNDLVDCDQDHPAWAALAPRFLPNTHSRFSRPGKPGGHALYICELLPDSAKFEDPIPVAEGGMGTIGEIRAGASQLTVFPVSFHKDSGEFIAWDENGEPAEVDGEELRKAYAEGCAWLMLQHHWPGEHTRHIPALALAGGLLRAGWNPDRVEELLRFVWPSAERGQIEGIIRTTDEKLQAGDQKVTGWVTLRDYINPAVVRRFQEWLGIKGGEDRPPLTDFGNAERFIARYGKDVRYCKPWRKWLLWDGKRWRIDETDLVYEWGKATIRAIPDEVQNEPDGDVRKKVLGWALASETGKRLETMLRLAQSVEGIAVSPDDFDQHRWLLNVANGTLDLRKLELREARREDLLTKAMPVAYLPDATCPNWERFVKTAMSSPADRGPVEQPEMEAYLQRLIGYMLTGDTSEKMVPIVYGPGNTGKTTMTEILLDLFGDDYGITTAETTIAANQGDKVPNDVAALRAARLVVVSETSEGMKLNEGRIKAMTGRNRMSARFFYQEWFTFIPEFKLIIETNHRPKITGTDTAIWNRVKPIPFLNVLTDEKKDPEMPDKLRAELPGILNWALAGCASWQAGGLQEPDLVKAANTEYRNESDTLREFLSECCVTETDKRTRSGDVYRAYAAFMEARGNHPLGDQRFSALLKERGFQKKESKGINYWLKLELRNEGPGAGLFGKAVPRGGG